MLLSPGSRAGRRAAAFPAGTRMLFQQASAPPGWRKDTTHNDKALRIVSGSVGAGGSVAFSTVFGRTATDAHTLTTAEIPAHSHAISTGSHAHVVHTGAHSHGGVTVPGGVFSLGQAGYTTQTGRTDTMGDLGGNTDTVGNLGGGTDAQAPAVTVVANSAGAITVEANTGGGAAHTVAQKPAQAHTTNMPPFHIINFIIRFQ
jgi:hypothetical protein